ncbi:glycosyltransferase family 4 protein [Enterovirga rhinocerotis]|uniref:Glycosyltransferase involved in cell wall biosynthesis n=1 Tax=Enterovirga rhinocerotis TaxID=1339210 RepID=A0A4R7BSL6_9HYPH|nr:glycosyltransferase family 4 protein [Enterovirga rhinocerotis]TDR88263.1 glycosyltransferase involved in cell wall biosynthesis [Enterovirga rhinocerotis]
MRIAILSHLRFPIGPPFTGGLERHTHLLASGLRARGHEVALFAAEGSDPALRPIPVCPPIGAATGDPRADAASAAREAAAYAQMLRRVAAGGFEIVHNNCLHEATLAGPLPAPMALTLHVPPWEPFASALRQAAARIDIVAVSSHLARVWSGVAPRIAVIGNGVDLAAFAPNLAPARPPYALWSGRVSPEKGLHLAIDAARLAGMPLRFAGARVCQEYWDSAIAPRLGLGVTDLGHLGETDLTRQLREARVAVVSPVWEEPFGLVVAEALACGTPVAGFRRGALQDILDTATGRLAEPGDVAGLARAIAEAARLDRAACRARAESTLDARLMIERYEALYAEMSATRRGRDVSTDQFSSSIASTFSG